MSASSTTLERVAGSFISFEGGDGVGKSTQITLLAERLREAGRTVVTTREPGGTPLGVRLREIILSPESEVSARSETLLYAADRAHHVDTVIVPALARGDDVITDRFADSTLAYQGVGRELDARQIWDLSVFAIGGRWPDVTVLLDADPEIGLSRARTDGVGDRIEAEGLAFHQAVREAFLDLSRAHAERYVVIDAAGTPGEVAGRVWAAISDRIDS